MMRTKEIEKQLKEDGIQAAKDIKLLLLGKKAPPVSISFLLETATDFRLECATLLIDIAGYFSACSSGTSLLLVVLNELTSTF